MIEGNNVEPYLTHNTNLYLYASEVGYKGRTKSRASWHLQINIMSTMAVFLSWIVYKFE